MPVPGRHCRHCRTAAECGGEGEDVLRRHERVAVDRHECAVRGDRSRIDVVQVERLRQRVQGRGGKARGVAGAVRIEVGKVTAICAADATLLAGALAKLRRAKLPMWFNNLEPLEGVLRAALNEKSSDPRPYWMLLF